MDQDITFVLDIRCAKHVASSRGQGEQKAVKRLLVVSYMLPIVCTSQWYAVHAERNDIILIHQPNSIMRSELTRQPDQQNIATWSTHGRICTPDIHYCKAYCVGVSFHDRSNPVHRSVQEGLSVVFRCNDYHNVSSYVSCAESRTYQQEQ